MKLTRIEVPEKLPAAAPAFRGPDDVHLWIFQGPTAERLRADRQGLREVLSLYTGIAPAELQFEIEGAGKPRLADARLHFNLSHSGDALVIAVTELGPVGVDLEQVRALEKIEPLMERFYQPSEREWVRTHAASERTRAFFVIWTAKEAWAKARAQSVFQALSRYEWDPKAPAHTFTVGAAVGTVSTA